MRSLTTCLLVIMIGLQVRLWAGDGSLAEVWRLDRDIASQVGENAALQARNGRMLAQVDDLRNGLDAVEHLARRELGLVAPNETFFLIIND
jgi:cell division protein FtsB